MTRERKQAEAGSSPLSAHSRHLLRPPRAGTPEPFDGRVQYERAGEPRATASCAKLCSLRHCRLCRVLAPTSPLEASYPTACPTLGNAAGGKAGARIDGALGQNDGVAPGRVHPHALGETQIESALLSESGHQEVHPASTRELGGLRRARRTVDADARNVMRLRTCPYASGPSVTPGQVGPAPPYRPEPEPSKPDGP